MQTVGKGLALIMSCICISRLKAKTLFLLSYVIIMLVFAHLHISFSILITVKTIISTADLSDHHLWVSVLMHLKISTSSFLAACFLHLLL